MKARDRFALVLAGMASLVGLAAWAWRVRRGIDYTDEAFYLALPMRFALGDRPFVDELNIAQTAGLLIYPFVKLHMLVRGTTGIVSFIRLLYVTFFVAVGASTYRLARLKLPAHGALLVGAATAPFLPYGLPALSYNTLGGGLLAAGLFVTARGLLSQGRDVGAPRPHRDPLCWGGFLLGAAAFAYPSLVSSAVFATGSVFLLARGRRLASTARVALGGAAFVAVVSPVFLRAGVHHVREALTYSVGGIAVTESKFPTLWHGYVTQHPELLFTFGVTALALGLARRWPWVAALLLSGVPLLARETNVTGIGASLGFVASLAMLGPLFALAVRDSRFGVVLLVGVWFPSACAGAAIAWSSGNGPVAAGLGLYPAAIASVVLAAVWIDELTRALTPLRFVLGFAPVLTLYVMVKLLLADDAVYRDAAVPQLTARITEGPYKGLFTTPVRRASLARTSRQVNGLVKNGRSVFYYDFPAGYLITQTRPVLPSAWVFAIEPRVSIDARVFAERAQPGDVVFHVGGALDPARNALDRAVTSRTVPVGNQEGFSIFAVP